MVHRLISLILSNVNVNPVLSVAERNELQYQSIRIVSILIRFDDQWLSTQQELIEAFKQIWCSDEYQVNIFLADKLTIIKSHTGIYITALQVGVASIEFCLCNTCMS